jgi:tetrahydromethanopterin S-methyltransferase subunit G
LQFRLEYIMSATSALEKESLEAHVDLCALRYEQMDKRLTQVEEKIDNIHEDIKNGNQSLVKVLIGATGTIIAGLLSTIVVLLVSF